MGKVIMESFDATLISFGVESYDQPIIENEVTKYQNFAFLRFAVLGNVGQLLTRVKRSYQIGVDNDEAKGAVQAWNDFTSAGAVLKAHAVDVINEYKGD